MKILSWFIFLLPVLCTQPLRAQPGKYSAATIPVNLKINADAVIRNEEVKISIKNPDEALIYRKKAITILNRNGKYDGAIRISYNKSRPIRSISGTLYDADGRSIRKFKKSDFEDKSDIEDFSLFEDNREKQLLPGMSEYPYTVEYEYSQKYKFISHLHSGSMKQE